MTAVPEIVCLDADVWIKFLVRDEEPEELNDRAGDLVAGAYRGGSRVIAPAFAWAEIGAVLRKKVRRQLLSVEDARLAWSRFSTLPIDFVNTKEVRARSWELADEHGLLTLYDAAYLACAELAGDESAGCTFWTADATLLRALGTRRPAFVRDLRASA
jgi:predicted nucleic acid-binding protein